MQKILAGTLQDLEIKGRLIVKSGKSQILVLRSSKGIHAVDHRCPHEGRNGPVKRDSPLS